MHKHGGKVFTFGPQRISGWSIKAYQYGVDGIITDFSAWPVEGSIFLANE